nr:MAG: hypothetical protein 3 [Leviviridae sp.]
MSNGLTQLWRELALECASWCGTSADHDVKTVMARVEAQGESFLTITLPQFDKGLTRSLELGCIDYSLFTGFRRRGGLPVFLRGFLSQIFDSHGVLLDEPNIDCIRAVRQLTLNFGKIERLSKPARVARAMRQYVELEEELKEIDISSLEEFLPRFRKTSTLLWGDVFAQVENKLEGTQHLGYEWLEDESPSEVRIRREQASDPMDNILGLPALFNGYRKKPEEFQVGREKYSLPSFGVGSWDFKRDELFVPISDPYALVPRHGPGATADGLRGNAKFDVSSWPERLERVFPYGDYALPSWRFYDQLDRVQFLEPGAEVPVKVTPVPKTDKTPRIIAEEPTAVQYAQQALCHEIIDGLEHGAELPPSNGGKDSALGRFFVGFEDQESNRILALEGSLYGEVATLDLSEASDRVLNEHVLLLFERFPRLSEAIQATRSTKARVPGHGVIPLSKFSSMGSALCFPVEAMVFTTIVLMAISYERSTPMDRAFIYSMRGQVRVYGDDIIVPVDCVHRVIQFLEAYGLKVNRDKSFWNGKFRESCGGDFYDGEWVTPIRLRQELPRSLADVKGVVGLVAYRNLLYWGGYWKTASYLDEKLNRLLKGRWPIVERTAAGLGRESVLSYESQWIDQGDHAPRVRGAIVSSRVPKSKASGTGALLKFFLKRGNVPFQDKEHLFRQGRPESVRIKLRGIRPY